MEVQNPDVLDGEPSSDAVALRSCLAVVRWGPRHLADALMLNERMVRRMCAGVRPIPPIVLTWMRMLADVHTRFPMPEGWPEQLARMDHTFAADAARQDGEAEE